jgi:hypothetical protein
MEASRLSGEVGEQAYFHHELGILALCGGQLDRARAELEASIGLRGALADKRGTVAGRRALALVADRSGATPPGGRTAAGEEVPHARHEESASPPGGVPAGFGMPAPVGDTAILVTHRPVAEPARGITALKGVVKGTRRNLVAAGAGAALAAVLGTVVTLGMTSNSSTNTPSENVRVGPSASQGADDSLGTDKAGKTDKGGDGRGSGATNAPTPTDPGPDGTSDDPTQSSTGDGPSDKPTGTHGSTPSKSHTPRPSSSSPSPSKSSSSTPSGTPSDSGTPTGNPSPTATTTPPATTNSASGPASSSAPATTTGSASVPASGSAPGTPSSSGAVI